MKVRFLFKTLLTTLVFSAILFLAAGKIDYFQGWIFLATNLLTALMNFWTIRNDAELMTERSKLGEGAKSWDKLILGLSGLTYIAALVLAGLDSGRYQWSPVMPAPVYAAGVTLTLLGQWLFLAARKENLYFSSVVRIQSDRGHQVCDTGVYAVLRHPGYLGMSISLAALPLLAGALWSYIPVTIAIVLLLIRTALEDATLQRELPGYAAYCERVRWRVFVWVW